jgi:predicted nucleotidyltransferase
MQAAQHDAIESDLFQLCNLLQQGGLDLSQTGITGSLLIGAQQAHSDIDLVCYSRAAFHQCRDITRELIERQHLHELDEHDWQASYQRRSCDLSYSDYVWHERRKYNKAVINGRKFDLNFIDDTLTPELTPYQKTEAITLQCTIIDDTHAFDYPAEFKIAHDHIDA